MYHIQHSQARQQEKQEKKNRHPLSLMRIMTNTKAVVKKRIDSVYEPTADFIFCCGLD